MSVFSNDKDINAMCNKLVSSQCWRIVRHGKHFVLRHVSAGATKSIAIAGTPSDPRAYDNFRKDYFRYIRDYMIMRGVIIPHKEMRPI